MSGEELKAAHPNTDQGVTADVTQDDRIAAVDIHNVILHDWFTQHMLDGMEDECYVIQAFARHRLSSTAALEAEIASLKQRLESAEDAARFLLDRLVDHEVRMTSDEDSREWYGHVTPAMARLRTALQEQEKQNG